MKTTVVFNVNTLSKLLGVSRQTIYNWCNKGELKEVDYDTLCRRIPDLIRSQPNLRGKVFYIGDVYVFLKYKCRVTGASKWVVFRAAVHKYLAVTLNQFYAACVWKYIGDECERLGITGPSKRKDIKNADS